MKRNFLKQEETVKNRCSIRQSKKDKTAKVNINGKKVYINFKSVYQDNLANKSKNKNNVLQENKKILKGMINAGKN